MKVNAAPWVDAKPLSPHARASDAPSGFESTQTPLNLAARDEQLRASKSYGEAKPPSNGRMEGARPDKEVDPGLNQSMFDQLRRRDLTLRLYEQAREAEGVKHAAHVNFEQQPDQHGKLTAVDLAFGLETATARNGFLPPKDQPSTGTTSPAQRTLLFNDRFPAENVQQGILPLDEGVDRFATASTDELQAEEKPLDTSRVQQELFKARHEAAMNKKEKEDQKAVAKADDLIKEEEMASRVVDDEMVQNITGPYTTDKYQNSKKPPLFPEAQDQETAREELEKILLSVKPLLQQANLLGYVSQKFPFGENGLLDISV